MAQLRLRALSVMDVPTAKRKSLRIEKQRRHVKLPLRWTSLSQVCTRSTAPSIARWRTASVSASRRFCTLEMRLTSADQDRALP